MQEYRGINDPAARADALRLALALRDAVSDRGAARGVDAKALEVIAVTGGTGLLVTSLAAVLTMTVPIAFALVPAILGAVTAGTGTVWLRQATTEQAILTDLKIAMDAIISGMR